MSDDRSKSKIEKVGIKVRIPKSLADQVTLLMLDPLRLRVGYGNWTNLMTNLLQNWVDEQIKGAQATMEKKDE